MGCIHSEYCKLYKCSEVKHCAIVTSKQWFHYRYPLTDKALVHLPSPLIVAGVFLEPDLIAERFYLGEAHIKKLVYNDIGVTSHGVPAP